MNNKPIAIVTGANGFVGSHLCDFLIDNKYEVYAVVRETSNLRWLKTDKLKLVYADLEKITDEELEEKLNGINPDYVFHIAGRIKGKTQTAFLNTNAVATKKLVNKIGSMFPNLKRFVYLSSLTAAGPSELDHPINEDVKPHPVSWYGESKLEGEKALIANMHKMKYTILRPPIVFGPRDMEFLALFKMAKYKIRIGAGKQKQYSFIYIDDLVQGIYQTAISSNTINDIYFISNNQFHLMDNISSMIEDTLNKKSIIKLTLPISIFYICAFFNHIFSAILNYTPMLNKQKVNEIKQKAWTCSNIKIVQATSWAPKYSLKQAIDITARWYNEKKYL